MDSSSIDTRTVSTCYSDENKRLHEIMSNPEELAFFETFLYNMQAHENLLFIEALYELKHEKSTQNIEAIVNRIWKTFLAKGAPLELNVQSKESIEEYIQSHKWGFLDKDEVIDHLKEIEAEVKLFLTEKTIEFDKLYRPERVIFYDSNFNKYKKRVVVIGGGFTGFTVASILDPMPRFHVTLIDTKDSFEYTPGMIKLLVRPEETSSLRVRHDAYVKNGRVIIGYAEQITHDAKYVKVNDEFIPFDYLVIATGSTYQSKLKSFDTSSLYRLSELAAEHVQLKKAKSVLIIGGGLVGCELASEIATHKYPAPYDFKKKITIIDSHSSLVRRSSPKQKANALQYFDGLGVQVILNEKIVDFDTADTNSYLGASGTRYSGYDKVFLATGTTACSDILKGDGDAGFETCLDSWGRIRVKPTLQVEHWKHKHIFAGGDVTNIVEEKTGYAATLAGVCIARNICRLEKGKNPLDQGCKGTMPAPSKPLHGIEERGGVGRQSLSNFKKTFAFLNPTWAALKYFDEKEFLNIVQGEAKLTTTAAIGKKPKALDLPGSHYCQEDSNSSIFNLSHLVKQQTNKKTTSLLTSSRSNSSTNLTAQFHRDLQISTKNMSGSDVISSSSSSSPLESQLKKELISTQNTSHSDEFVWPKDNLKPRPTHKTSMSTSQFSFPKQVDTRQRSFSNDHI
ncbi:uncharacterized protein B0P05DRAFT_530617 [Gilbertella persicaria]|uniref:uncharacterized protein n=1 Tax=Gilbertella persicaria TaxID=101096 RepID=UPI00221E5886|nr:uncharacterized protein B0P05DRAFT_530617 [Gilbertella persicaria]KAI8087908.1 hypothetical protein B0P05DRAFT_530617 [Gilbertella persicaria]